MGRAKHDWMEQQERGFYSVGEKYVCSECVEDPDIRNFVRSGGEAAECDYCNVRAEYCVPFDDLSEFVLSGIRSEYGDPNDEGVPWDKGWIGAVFDTWDLLYDEIGITAGEAVIEDLLAALGDHQWCKRGFHQLDPNDVLRYGWKEFVEVVKHKARFVFYRVPNTEKESRGHEEIPPGHFLDAFSYAINDADITTVIPKGSRIYRVRVHSDKVSFSNSAQLGTTPQDQASYSNRMSPAGIAMFYGAFDIKTAIRETYDAAKLDKIATIGEFETLRDLVVVAFSNLPAVPGIFKERSRDSRHALLFLQGFAEDISAPVSKDGREHVDYAPTQIITEHLRHIHRTGMDEKVDGVIYESARMHGADACVLFAENGHCCDEGKEDDHSLLKLVDVWTVDPREYM